MPMPRGKRLVVLAVILPLAIALHVYLVWLGGGWRIFALVEAGIGLFVVLAMRDARRLDERASAPQREPKLPWTAKKLGARIDVQDKEALWAKLDETKN
jgi:hypothetical protein